MHQVNIEYLARTIMERNGQAYPDTVVGTDSHTTMVNGLGVLGWGVGGIEAEAAMLGQPVAMLIPQVVGFRLEGALPAGSTATDLVRTVTERTGEPGAGGKAVGAFGSLGVIISLCLKLWPTPPGTATVTVSDLHQASAVVRPLAVLEVDGTLQVFLQGTEAEVEAPAERLGGKATASAMTARTSWSARSSGMVWTTASRSWVFPRRSRPPGVRSPPEVRRRSSGSCRPPPPSRWMRSS